MPKQPSAVACKATRPLPVRRSRAIRGNDCQPPSGPTPRSEIAVFLAWLSASNMGQDGPDPAIRG